MMSYWITGILGILAGLGWGYGWGSQSTYKFYAPRLASKDNVLWKDFNRNVKTIEKLRKRLAGKYITDQRNTHTSMEEHSNEQIKYMVNRFLGWRLPEHFRPDAGISFQADFNEHTAWPMKHQPIGTNLFDASQAEVMVRYMIEGISQPTSDNG